MSENNATHLLIIYVIDRRWVGGMLGIWVWWKLDSGFDQTIVVIIVVIKFCRHHRRHRCHSNYRRQTTVVIIVVIIIVVIKFCTWRSRKADVTALTQMCRNWHLWPQQEQQLEQHDIAPYSPSKLNSHGLL